MRLSAHALFAAALGVLPQPAAAQQRVAQPPIKVVPPSTFPPLGPTALSSPGCQISHVGQIELRPIAGQPANVFHTVLSVKVNGGTTWDLVTGTFDCDAPAFSKNTFVDHLNGSGSDEVCGSVSNDLLVLVYQTAAPNPLRYATRSTATSAFGPGSPITGVPAGSRHPKLAMDEGGVEKLMWASAAGDVVWAPFNRSTGAVNIASAFTLVDGPGLHSPEPLRDPSGVARAVLLGLEVSPAQSDAWYAAGKFNLPPAPRHELHVQGTYLQLGTALGGGGTVIMPQGPAFGDPLKIDFEATNCDAKDPGATAVICNFFPYKPVTTDTEVVALALGRLGQQAFAIPGVTGLLGLDPLGPLVILPLRGTVPYTGVSCYTLGIPLSVSNIMLASQALALHVPSLRVFLGNNSAISIR